MDVAFQERPSDALYPKYRVCARQACEAWGYPQSALNHETLGHDQSIGAISLVRHHKYVHLPLDISLCDYRLDEM